MQLVRAVGRALGPALFMAALVFAGPALAIDFGNDSSRWANDGECDDPRFSGPGMTATLRLDADILHDATDCRLAHEAGRITLSEPGVAAQVSSEPDQAARIAEESSPQPQFDQSPVDFGDDSSQWANDGECDDPRFAGPGMTTTTLIDDDIRNDATDCRTKFEAGEITLKETEPGAGQQADVSPPAVTPETAEQRVGVQSGLEEPALMRLKKVYRDHQLLTTCAGLPGLDFETSAIDTDLDTLTRLLEERGEAPGTIRDAALSESDSNHQTAMRALAASSAEAADDERTRQATVLLCSMYENSLTDNIRWLSDHLARR